jgi:hypothetical protein
MLNTDTLQQIANKAASIGPLNEAALEALKTSWPELRFTLCNDDDMPARLPPSLQSGNINIYLVGGGEHCLSLTQNIEQAIGVVLAQVDEE